LQSKQTWILTAEPGVIFLTSDLDADCLTLNLNPSHIERQWEQTVQHGILEALNAGRRRRLQQLACQMKPIRAHRAAQRQLRLQVASYCLQVRNTAAVAAATIGLPAAPSTNQQRRQRRPGPMQVARRQSRASVGPGTQQAAGRAQRARESRRPPAARAWSHDGGEACSRVDAVTMLYRCVRPRVWFVS
jgi:hypothetical protein